MPGLGCTLSLQKGCLHSALCSTVLACWLHGLACKMLRQVQSKESLQSSSAAHAPTCLQIVSAKYVQRGKPAPDVYLETLRRVGCTDASQALVVEDAGELLSWAGSAFSAR